MTTHPKNYKKEHEPHDPAEHKPAEHKPTEKGLQSPVFATLIHSLASSALIAMGLVPEMKDKKNRLMAQFNIDLLILLKEKTLGNLNTDEQLLLDNCIRDLQVYFSQMPVDNKATSDKATDKATDKTPADTPTATTTKATDTTTNTTNPHPSS